MLEVKNLSVGYNDKVILKDINVHVKSGELIGIIGPNGVGKSTLLKTLANIIEPIHGEIYLNGKEIGAYKTKELSREIAYLQQNSPINFSFTAKDIVLAGRYPYKKWWESENKADELIVEQCLSYTGTMDLKDRPISEVSGGQKQRILLAKILAQQTPMLFLDEPTTGLDIVYQEEIFYFAKELAAMNKAVLMVVHDLALAAKFCQRLWLIVDGKLLADDIPQKIYQGDLLSKAYKAPLKIIYHEDIDAWTINTDFQTKDDNRKLLKMICGGENNTNE